MIIFNKINRIKILFLLFEMLQDIALLSVLH
jgi:hypothetical protein